MPRTHINARPKPEAIAVPSLKSGSTTWDRLAAMLARTKERPPVVAGGPSAPTRVRAREERSGAHRNGVGGT